MAAPAAATRAAATASLSARAKTSIQTIWKTGAPACENPRRLLRRRPRGRGSDRRRVRGGGRRHPSPAQLSGSVPAARLPGARPALHPLIRRRLGLAALPARHLHEARAGRQGRPAPRSDHADPRAADRERPRLRAGERRDRGADQSRDPLRLDVRARRPDRRSPLPPPAPPQVRDQLAARAAVLLQARAPGAGRLRRPRANQVC
jgi:hypothetical protein